MPVVWIPRKQGDRWEAFTHRIWGLSKLRQAQLGPMAGSFRFNKKYHLHKNPSAIVSITVPWADFLVTKGLWCPMIGKVLEFEIRNPANMWVEAFVPIKFWIYFFVVKHWSFLKEALKCTWVWRYWVENPYKETSLWPGVSYQCYKCSYDFCSGQGQGGGRAEGPRWFPESFGDSKIWRNNSYHPTCQEGVCFKHSFVQQQRMFFFRTMHFLYSKFLSNATRTSARRKSRGSRKKWASWLLEHVKGGKFSVETTAKTGTNTSPLKLDCCLFSAWGVIHMIGTKFGGSWLCGCFLVDPQKHQSYAFGPSICYSLARQLFNTWVCPNG